MNEDQIIHSSFCDAGNCVEVEKRHNWIIVRHSESVIREVIYSLSEWTAFISGVKAGEFDL